MCGTSNETESDKRYKGDVSCENSCVIVKMHAYRFSVSDIECLFTIFIIVIE